MSALTIGQLFEQFEIQDVRQQMDRADWEIGRRPGNPTSLTLHFDGAAPVRLGRENEIQHLINDSLWHTRPGAFGVASGGDGIMYHLAVLSDGLIVQLRDLNAQLWHSGNKDANKWSLAVQLPLGIGQRPTDYQWARFCSLALALGATYAMPGGRNAIKGHCDWPRSDGTKQKSCPGTIVYPMLKAFRAAQEVPSGDVAYRIRSNIDFAAIRTGPDRTFPRALGGTAAAMSGERVLIDKLLPATSGSGTWAHLSPRDERRDLGFISADLLVKEA